MGHQTAKRLQALGLVSVKDLQLCPLNDLAKEFGSPTAQRLKNLSLGVDDLYWGPSGRMRHLRFPVSKKAKVGKLNEFFFFVATTCIFSDDQQGAAAV